MSFALCQKNATCSDWLPFGRGVYVTVVDRHDFSLFRSRRFHSTSRLNNLIAHLMFNRMVEQQASPLDRVFGALSDPTRRAMLRRLAGGTRTVGELAEPFDMSFAAAAKHVKVLEEAGLLSRTIEGRTHRCRIEAGPLAQADRWLTYYERFWSLRLDDLEQALVRESRKRSRK